MPIATISYNSDAYLNDKLEELQRNKVISAWFWVEHLPEEDEKKKHKHVWLKPNKRIDTMELQEFFLEPFKDERLKPLGCIDFVSSKIDDAILYFAHWKAYLAFKHQSRKYHYDWSVFHCSNDDWFDDAINHALHGSEFAERSFVLNAIQDNRSTLSELVTTGVVPLTMASQVRAFSQLLDDDRVERAGRVTHTPKSGENGLTVTSDGLIGGGGVIIEE